MRGSTTHLSKGDNDLLSEYFSTIDHEDSNDDDFSGTIENEEYDFSSTDGNDDEFNSTLENDNDFNNTLENDNDFSSTDDESYSDRFSNTEEHFKKFDPLDVEYFSHKRDHGNDLIMMYAYDCFSMGK